MAFLSLFPSGKLSLVSIYNNGKLAILCHPGRAPSVWIWTCGYTTMLQSHKSRCCVKGAGPCVSCCGGHQTAWHFYLVCQMRVSGIPFLTHPLSVYATARHRRGREGIGLGAWSHRGSTPGHKGEGIINVADCADCAGLGLCCLPALYPLFPGAQTLEALV